MCFFVVGDSASLEDDNLDGAPIVQVYRALMAYAMCVYATHVLSDTSDQPLDWMDPSILDQFPGLANICFALQGRVDLHQVRLVRSAAFVLNRAVFCRHRAAPPQETIGTSLVLTIGVLLMVTAQQHSVDARDGEGMSDADALAHMSAASFDEGNQPSN